MTSLDNILNAARGEHAKIAFPEGEDPRVVEAAVRIAKDGIALPVLIGRRDVVRKRLSQLNANDSQIDIVNPRELLDAKAYADAYYQLRQHKGVSFDDAQKAVQDPLVFANLMARLGEVDGTIGGAVATTADTVRAALQVIGKAPGVEIVSSFFLMMLNQPHHPKHGVFCFADCGLVVEPSVEELAQIAISSAASYRALTNETPRVGMLSFSTGGSADHARAGRMAEAAVLVRKLAPALIVDGELQFDAAFVPAVASAKAPHSPLRGDANVLVFPSLEAANIGYKIAQRIGGAAAIGPILQGLKKPCNDLSRGCTVDDIYHMAAVTAVQTKMTAEARL